MTYLAALLQLLQFRVLGREALVIVYQGSRLVFRLRVREVRFRVEVSYASPFVYTSPKGPCTRLVYNIHITVFNFI